MQIVENIKTGVANTLKDPLAACFGVAYWVLCLGCGAYVVQYITNLMLRINGF